MGTMSASLRICDTERSERIAIVEYDFEVTSGLISYRAEGG